MSEYEEFIKLRNRMLESDFELFEEDVQLIDKFLDDYEKKYLQLAELQASVNELGRLWRRLKLKEKNEIHSKLLIWKGQHGDAI